MDSLYTNLRAFLAAGTLSISIDDTGALNTNHKLADDGWATLTPENPVTPDSFPDATRPTMESLHFLVRHRFVAATYKINNTERLLFFRVYVIPWDLPGSKGALRSRDEDTVLRRGRRRLKALFLLIKQDKSLWDGDTASGSTPKYFWENVVVGCPKCTAFHE